MITVTGKNQTYTESLVLVTEICCNCGIMFAMPDSLQDRLIQLRGKKLFYCPNGHSQYYVGESDADKAKRLEAELQRAKADTTFFRDCVEAERTAKEVERSKRLSAEKNIRSIKTRIQNGVCIHCNRSFKDLAKHMQSKHHNCKAA